MKAYKFKKLHSRRVFLSRMVQAGIILNLPLLDACVPKSDIPLISVTNEQILKDVLYFLWPEVGGGPSVSELKIYEYFLWFFSDLKVDPEEKEYLFKGMDWIDESSKEDFNVNYEKLKKDQKDMLLNKISVTDWGESWLSKVINIIIEAIFSNPIYGSNPYGIGYKWFEHNPGFPQPDNSNKYQELLKRKKENVKISSIEQL